MSTLTIRLPDSISGSTPLQVRGASASISLWKNGPPSLLLRLMRKVAICCGPRVVGPKPA